ncbi:MAG: gliding motility-associated C-terminal domain-containing protein [Paludibacteraceae bacterium]|nr:gliding motility-associated C-terminal domain-containing protein [Paludibacteraceae bacterium]
MKSDTRHKWVLLGLIVLSTFNFQFSTLSAASVECVGTATQLVNGRDTLFVFKDEIHLRSTRGDVDWYKTDGSSVATATDEIYPDEGGYFTVLAGDTSAPCYVFLYSLPDDLSLSLAPDCNATTLTLTGDTKPFTYTRLDGTSGSYARACSINYNALAWNGEEWADSAAQMLSSLRAGNYILPALYAGTDIQLCYDADIRSRFGLDSACIIATLAPDDVQAVNFQLTSLVTSRGTEGEKSNERNRPTSQDLIEGSEYSGALEVAFYSNPTPEVKFFRWAIYQSTNLLATRHDQDIRYTFSEPGSYRVVCSVNNQYCAADSMEVTVNISESYLAVPNVFTPNGDGQNDEFRVAYRSLREFHCWVYNRWGHLVYEWDDPAKGWDGNIGNRPAAEGAYFYVIRALGTDAAKDARYVGLKASYKKKKANAEDSVMGVYQLSGDINLLRGK